MDFFVPVRCNLVILMNRFHVLQEFDEGKRSCRRRLAGHNKRRRKTHPENVVSGGSLNDENGSGYLLISLLRILSNLPSKYASSQVHLLGCFVSIIKLQQLFPYNFFHKQSFFFCFS